MPRTIARRDAALPYSPVARTQPEVASAADRAACYRSRALVVRRLEQLVALGRTDQAVRFALPVTALLETAPLADLDEAALWRALDELALADAEDDVERARFRLDPSRRRPMIDRLHRTIAHMTRVVRALEAMA